jgi:2-oxo-4-hydroxy-4-carboxy--5-ureidoimidazoline (OHCU) decarboxylase
LTASAALAAWWVKPGFKDWFLSTSVTEERVDFLLHLALSAAEAILTNDDPRGQSARVAMIKTVAEMAGKLGSARASAAPAATAQDRKIQAIERMTPTELKEFLRASGVDVQTVLTLPQGASEGT